jgi:hypothetical protein
VNQSTMEAKNKDQSEMRTGSGDAWRIKKSGKRNQQENTNNHAH